MSILPELTSTWRDVSQFFAIFRNKKVGIPNFSRPTIEDFTPGIYMWGVRLGLVLPLTSLYTIRTLFGPLKLSAPPLYTAVNVNMTMPARKRSRGRRSRYWVFTLNNPQTHELWLVLPEGATYLCWQAERGEQQRTCHLQGYVELEKEQYLSWLSAKFGARCHFEIRRGTAKEASDYCMKEDTRAAGPWELGTMTAPKSGLRTDLMAFRDAIRSQISARKLWDDFPLQMARYPRMFADVRMLSRPMRSDEGVEVTLFFGKTGLGKTRFVYDKWEEDEDFWRWSVPNTAPWFDGYDMHEYVLLDDFAGRASKMSLVMLLQVLDRYPVLLPVKRSFTWWKPRKIALTTNIHPRDWYDYTNREGQYMALKRRIHHVIDITVKIEEGEEYEQSGSDFWYDPNLFPRPIAIDLELPEFENTLDEFDQLYPNIHYHD